MRDHRRLGRELDLYMFDPIAPASPFFLPKGATIYNKLVEYVSIGVFSVICCLGCIIICVCCKRKN